MRKPSKGRLPRLSSTNRSSRPFFIAILGERYGFVPDKMPEDAEFAYPWLKEYSTHSLTALEIIHGVLRNPDLAKRSFFYFRNPQFISQMPEGKRADFTAENPEAARKLAIVKSTLGPSHSLFAIILENLGWLHHQQGKHEEALPYLERAMRIGEATLGRQHPYTKLFIENLKACQDAMR